MNKTIFTLLLALLLFSCSHPESYTHKINDQTGIDGLAVTYVGRSGQIAAAKTSKDTFMPPHFTDSVSVTIVNEEHLLQSPRFAEKYVNGNGTITITKNVYHDYFPTEWSSLRKSNNFLTYQFVQDEAHFYFLVFNTLNGSFIASYFEYE